MTFEHTLSSLTWLYTSNILISVPAKNSVSDLACSENVAYDTVGSTVKRSTQANVPCSKNVAYATVIKTDDSIQNPCTSHAAVYEEVQL